MTSKMNLFKSLLKERKDNSAVHAILWETRKSEDDLTIEREKGIAEGYGLVIKMIEEYFSEDENADNL